MKGKMMVVKVCWGSIPIMKYLKCFSHV